MQIGNDHLFINRDELTQEKFIADPFCENGSSPLYCTGDLVKWLPDGNVEYLGRIDEQVKIRGYRIEPGEVESVLLESGLVKQAVVLAKKDGNGSMRLVGYVVTTGMIDKQMIISYLQGKLPNFMIPVQWVMLEGLPLTNNGKIDKKALPDPDVTDFLYNEYVAPRTEVERTLVEIWKELLHLDRVGVKDNFFELGGHSLLAKRMSSFIERKLLISVPIQALFQFTTINDLSKYLELQLNTYPRKEDITEYKLLNI